MLADLQDKLYAQDRWSVLLIVQAMDAAGKDGTIKHVMSGVNPQGCQVYSFKSPSAEELDHDFLWRTTKCLPEQGRIGIFNRSYYEEVLAVRVHPEFLAKQKLPPKLVTKRIWKERFESIADFEKHLARNGMVVLKFFLNVSRKEQKRRFLERLELPDKNWKFSEADARERQLWKQYMECYEDAIRADGDALGAVVRRPGRQQVVHAPRRRGRRHPYARAARPALPGRGRREKEGARGREEAPELRVGRAATGCAGSYTDGMWERTFLRDLAVVLAASFPVLFVCRRLKVPQVVGFLVTGVAIGPHALGWVREASRVESIAEFGVALILLFVGLEFPLRRLKALGRTSLVGGTLQMALTTAGGYALARLWGSPANQAVFFGLLVSVSSTAVVLPILKQRDELAAPYGRRFLAVALFQDLAVIPILLFLPALVSGSGPGAAAVAGRVVLAIAGVGALIAVARRAAPHLLDAVARMGSRETFTGAVVVLVLLMVAAGEKAGVSAAMGAFGAGIVLGESDHVHEVAATLAPLHDLLSSLFFVSVGMLLEPAFLASRPLEVGAGVLALVAVKSVAAFAALRVAGTVPRTAARASLALANVGEFSFVLATTGVSLALLSGEARQIVVAATVGTLVLAPFLVAAGPALALRLPEAVEGAGDAVEKPRTRHIVVVGAGLNGTNVARVLQEIGIPHVLVDIDPERVADARREGLDALRADATGAEGQIAAGVDRALGVVVTMPDPDASRRTVRLARQRNAAVRILVRTRYVKEVDALRQLGADEVIPEEFETSIELVARVLRLLHVPGNVVATQIRLLRDEAYRRLRDPQAKAASGRRLSALVAAGTSELFLILPDTAPDGRLLGELDLAAAHVAVPAVLRDGVPHAPPAPDFRLAAGDTLVLVGAHEDLARVLPRLEAPAAG